MAKDRHAWPQCVTNGKCATLDRGASIKEALLHDHTTNDEDPRIPSMRVPCCSLVAQAPADRAGLLASRTFGRRRCRKRPKISCTLRDMSTDRAQTASVAAVSMAAASRRATGRDSCLHAAKLCTSGSRGAAKRLHGAVAVHRRGLVAVRAASLSGRPRRRPARARFFRRRARVWASVNARSGEDEHDVTAGKAARRRMRTYRMSDGLVRRLFWAIQEQERSPWNSQKAIL